MTVSGPIETNYSTTKVSGYYAITSGSVLWKTVDGEA